MDEPTDWARDLLPAWGVTAGNEKPSPPDGCRGVSHKSGRSAERPEGVRACVLDSGVEAAIRSWETSSAP